MDKLQSHITRRLKQDNFNELQIHTDNNSRDSRIITISHDNNVHGMVIIRITKIKDGIIIIKIKCRQEDTLIMVGIIQGITNNKA